MTQKNKISTNTKTKVMEILKTKNMNRKQRRKWFKDFKKKGTDA